MSTATATLRYPARPADNGLIRSAHYYMTLTPEQDEDNMLARQSVETMDEYRDIYLMNGQCHALALAVHEATGWPLMGSNYGRCLFGGDDTPNHIFVLMPDGRGFDALGPFSRGQHPDSRIEADWADLDVAAVERLHTFCDEFDKPEYLTPDMTVARAHATDVLAKLA